MPIIELPFILCFPCSDASIPRIVPVFEEGLSRIYTEGPFLVGSLVQANDGRSRPGSFSLKMSESDGPPTLTVEDMTSEPNKELGLTYDYLCEQGTPMSLLDRHWLTPTNLSSGRTTLLAAQATFIPGGYLLYVSTSHAFADGFGLYIILAAWARHCRNIVGTMNGESIVGTQSAAHVHELKNSPDATGNLCQHTPSAVDYE